MKRLIIALTLTGIMAAGSGRAEQTLEFDPVFDFGHIGIAYKVFHSYTLRNRGGRAIKLTSAQSSCDCTTFLISDSLIRAKDSTVIKIAFETTNYYGSTTRTVNFTTDSPDLPKFQLSHESVIGRWIYKMKPEPKSLFFLSNEESKQIALPNLMIDEVEIIDLIPSNDDVDLEIVRGLAAKGQNLVINVSPSGRLGPGKHHSSITIRVRISDNPTPYVLTIPVKVAIF